MRMQQRHRRQHLPHRLTPLTLGLALLGACSPEAPMESGDLTVASRAILGSASTIGVFRPTGTQFNTSTQDQWLLRYSNTAGNPDVSFSYGAPGDIPVVGDWTGSGT